MLVFANIHAGEVAGKEAALMILRDLANGRHAEWADSLVVMIAPIYNADGNERVQYGNRPYQLGPVGGMGQRPNAQGLDLNRDFTRLASPEARALVGLMRDVDPHVVVDLHTTDGTFMGYHLTFAPPLSPNTPEAIDRDLRQRWIPAIQSALLRTDDMATEHYGNVPGAFGEPTGNVPRAWYSYSGQPRYSSNYAGLRNRYALLSEAYSYATFQDRIQVSKRFVEEILTNAWRDASGVRATTAAADRQRLIGDSLAVRVGFTTPEEVREILLGAVDTLRHPETGEPMFQRRDVRTPEVMPVYSRFGATEKEIVPGGYLVPTSAAGVLELLALHGIRTEAPGRVPGLRAVQARQRARGRAAVPERASPGGLRAVGAARQRHRSWRPRRRRLGADGPASGAARVRSAGAEERRRRGLLGDPGPERRSGPTHSSRVARVTAGTAGGPLRSVSRETRLSRMTRFFAVLALALLLAGCRSEPAVDIHTPEDATRGASGAEAAATGTGSPLIEVEDAAQLVDHLIEEDNEITVLNFWATWCGPCRIEFPDLMAFDDEMEDENVEVRFVSVDDADMLPQVRGFWTSRA